MIARVYIDGKDITRWVRKVSWRQAPRTIWMEWSLSVSALVNVDWSAVDVAIYLCHTDSEADLYPVITGGVVPIDNPPKQRFGGEGVFTEVSGYDWVWEATRRTPDSTLVFLGEKDSLGSLLDASTLAVGRHRLIRQVGWHYDLATGNPVSIPWYLNQVVIQLAGFAGFGKVVSLLPEVEMAPFIVPPTQSYFEAIRSLVEPLRAEMLYRHERGGLIITDWLGYPTLQSDVLKIEAKALKRVESQANRRPWLKRLLIKVPFHGRTNLARTF